MNTKDIFQGLVGQEKVKNKLKFFADGKRSRGYIPAILMNGAAGLGKTEFSKKFAAHIGKPFVEINCGGIKNEETFFEGFFMNQILDKDVTVLFDECHKLPDKLMTCLLSVFNPEGAKRKVLEWRENRLEFNFEKQTYLFATTEAQELFDPFKKRLNKIDFGSYTTADLTEILKNKADYVVFKDGVLDELGLSLRGTARSAIARAVEVMLYCDNKNKHTFGRADWDELRAILDILPYGLSDVECQVLEILNNRGACTLQMLAASTGMSRAAIQQEAEIHLLREGLMKIDGKREISDKGRELMKSIK